MTSDRRAAGESSIVKGADGRFHGYVSMGLKENGKRDRRHVASVKRADVVAGCANSRSSVTPASCSPAGAGSPFNSG